jgi:uncharacterized membrane protein YgcG
LSPLPSLPLKGEGTADHERRGRSSSIGMTCYVEFLFLICLVGGGFLNMNGCLFGVVRLWEALVSLLIVAPLTNAAVVISQQRTVTGRWDAVVSSGIWHQGVVTLDINGSEGSTSEAGHGGIGSVGAVAG